MHESYRVYRDKLVDERDIEQFDKLLREVVKKSFEDMSETELFKQPLMFCHFASGIGDPKYMPVQTYAELNKLLVDALDNHNEINSAMNLVLFEVQLVYCSMKPQIIITMQ
jgi:dynein heavy chain, axonemal